MGSEQLVIGNVALAAVIIKTVVSTIKQMVPKFAENKTAVQVATLMLGILSAFMVGAELISIPDAAPWIQTVQTIIAGVFIASTAMGVHETTKMKKGS